MVTKNAKSTAKPALNFANTAKQLRKGQNGKREKSAFDIAEKARERERTKQTIRSLSKQTGWKFQDVAKLHRHYKSMEATMLFNHSFNTKPIEEKVKLGEQVDLFVNNFTQLESKWHPETVLEQFEIDSSFYRESFINLKQVQRQVKGMGFEQYVKGLHALCTQGNFPELLHFCFQLEDKQCEGKLSFSQVANLCSSHVLCNKGQESLYRFLKKEIKSNRCPIALQDLAEYLKTKAAAVGLKVQIKISIDSIVASMQ